MQAIKHWLTGISSKATKILLVVLAVLLVFTMLTVSSPRAAYAATSETITHAQIVDRNPLMIMSAKNLEKVLGVNPTSPTITSDQNDMRVTRLTQATELTNGETRYRIENYRKGLITAMATEYEQGFTIELPSVDNPGETGVVTIEYPVVGTYNGEPIGATVEYKVAHIGMQNPWMTADYQHVALQVSDSFFAGLDMCNVTYADAKVSFTYVSNGETVSLGENSMVTIGSLNYWSEFNTSEYVYALDSETIKMQTPDTNEPETLGNTNTIDIMSGKMSFGFRADGWVDIITHPTFYKQSASIFQTGDAFKLRVGNGYNQTTGAFHSDGQMWWSISGSSIAIPEPVDPVKTVDKGSAQVGESVTYTVDQEVHTAGLDIQGKYESLVFTDSLPKEVDYSANSAKMYKVTENGSEEITSVAGSFSYNSGSHTLTYTFSDSYLTDMEMNGETYRMVFGAVINNKAVQDESFTNKVVVAINDFDKEATAKTKPVKPADPVDPIKTVNKDSAQIGETMTYTVEQTVQTLNKDIFVRYSSFSFYDSLPAEVDYMADSAKMYRIDKAGDATDITTTAGTFAYSEKNHTLTYTFSDSYLKSMPLDGETYRMVFDTTVNDVASAGEPFTNEVTVFINNSGKNAEVGVIPYDPDEPIDPIKTVNKDIAQVGETITYTIEQTVQTLNKDIFVRYSSFSFYDSLPAEVDYTADSAKMYRIDKAGDATDITTTAGTFAYSEKNHTLTYTFSDSYLKSMPLDGETYRMVFDTTVNDVASAGEPFTNEVTVFINNSGKNAEVDVMPYNPGEPVKTANPQSGSVVGTGEVITYTVSYTNVSDYTEKVVLSDIIPEKTSYLEGTIDVGIDTKAADVLVDDAIDAETGRIETSALWNEVLPGESVAYTFSVIVDVNAEPDYVVENVGYLQRNDSPKISTNPVEHLVGGPVIEVIKGSDPEPGSLVKSNDVITYSLTVKNTGTGIAYDVAVFDAIPEHTNFESVDAIYNATYFDSTGIGWLIDTIAPGEEVVLKFAVKVTEDVPEATIIRNVATYDIEIPEIPNEPLPKTSNEITHETPSSESPLDKTGDMLQLGLILLGLATITTGIIVVARHRRKTSQR